MLIKRVIQCLNAYHEIPKILNLGSIKKNVKTIRNSPSGACVTTDYTILLDGIRIWAHCFSCSGVSSHHTVCYTNNTQPNQHRTYYFENGLFARVIYNEIARLQSSHQQNCQGIAK